jgi:hypothetical protein
LSFSIGYPKEEIKRLRFNISEFESLTPVIKDGIKCLHGQNEDAEKKAYELRQQLDELKVYRKKSTQYYEASTIFPEYRITNSTRRYENTDIDQLACKNT